MNIDEDFRIPAQLYSRDTFRSLQGINMKFYGILILVAGLALSVFALNMDVHVDVDSKDFGYGIRTPAMSVANVGLMEQRQNLLIFAGVLSVVGAILTGFASMRPATTASAPVAMKEGEGLLDFLNEIDSMPEKRTAKEPAEPTAISICPKCRSMGGGDDAECGRCGAALQVSA